MNGLNENNQPQHTLHLFDGELNLLQALLLEMAELAMEQLSMAMQALDEGDVNLAEFVILRDRDLDQYEVKIDAEVLSILARNAPVANDLRTVLSTSKIGAEISKMGDEIVDFAALVKVLFDPKTSDPNPKLLSDIVKIGELVNTMLGQLISLFNSRDTALAYTMLEYDCACENELQEGIRHQLSFVVQDARLISRALDVMQMMKSLERCGEFCRNIAEYIIFMIEGVDVRHNPNKNRETLS